MSCVWPVHFVVFKEFLKMHYFKDWRNEDTILKENYKEGCFFSSGYLHKGLLSSGQPGPCLGRSHAPQPAVISLGHWGVPGNWSRDLGWKHLLVLSGGQSLRIDVVFYSVPNFETSCKVFNGLKSLALIKYHLTQINRTDEWSQRNSLFTWLLMDFEVEKHGQGTSRVRGQLR